MYKNTCSMNILQLAAEEKTNKKKCFKCRYFNKTIGCEQCHRCKCSHGERLSADPDVGLCLPDGWSLQFLLESLMEQIQP